MFEGKTLQNCSLVVSSPVSPNLSSKTGEHLVIKLMNEQKERGSPRVSIMKMALEGPANEHTQ